MMFDKEFYGKRILHKIVTSIKRCAFTHPGELLSVVTKQGIRASQHRGMLLLNLASIPHQACVSASAYTCGTRASRE
jgi:hypothetical protein